MKYYKYEGSHWTTLYALDKETPETRVFELRYKGTGEDRVLEAVFAYIYTPHGSSYDVLAADTIETYQSITKKEWQEYERVVREYVKTVGGA